MRDRFVHSGRRFWVRVPGAALCGVGLATRVISAAAEGAAPGAAQRIELRWTAPEGCPGEASVIERVGQLVDHDPDRAIAAEARIRRRGAEFALELQTSAEGQTYRRELSSASCHELADAAALLLALAARHKRGVARPVASGPAPGAPPVETALPGVQAYPPSPLPASSPSNSGGLGPFAAEGSRPRQPRPSHVPWGLHAFGQSGVDVGTLPVAALVVGGGIAGTVRPFRLELLARHWLPREKMLDDAPTKGGKLWLTAASLRACWGSQRGDVAFCGGGELGSLVAQGKGVDFYSTRAVRWMAGTASARLGWAASPWFWAGAELEFAFPFWNYRFQLDRVGEVHRPSDISVRAAVRLELIFDARK